MTSDELLMVVTPLFDNLKQQISSLQHEYEKDVKRLFGQSDEHYNNAKILEDKVVTRFDAIKSEFYSALEKQAEAQAKALKDHIDSGDSKRQWSKEQRNIVYGGLILLIAAQAIPSILRMLIGG